MFTQEELNLLSIYDKADKTELIDAIRETAVDVSDPEMLALMESVIERLEDMTDAEFAEASAQATGDCEEAE